MGGQIDPPVVLGLRSITDFYFIFLKSFSQHKIIKNPEFAEHRNMEEKIKHD